MKNFIFFLLAVGMFFSCEKQDFWNLKKLGEVGSVSVNNNNLASITISANLIQNGHDDIKRIGFVWSDINTFPTLADNFSENTVIENKISTTVNWSVNTQLYVRSYIENSVGVYYSEPTKINWTGEASNLPTLVTINPNQFGFFELTINGNILSDGGIPISEQGFCYSESSASPTIANTVIVNSSGNTSFSEFLSNLNENTTYFIRAFAKNLQGISYGNVITISTKNYYYVGETGPQGGIIFLSKMDTIGGWNFLEAAASDVSGLLPWAFNSNSIATTYGLGSGMDNTNNIIQQFGSANPNYAAFAASNYSFVNGSNWYLPSRDELIKMKEVLFLTGMGNFSVDATYWSSSQDPNFNTNAWTVKMSTGVANPSTYGKTALFRIRPIRQF
jgi:hypothetical protein